MKRKNILTAPFVLAMEDTTANMYRLGWDERNGGNISYLLDEKEVAQYLDLTQVKRTIPTGFDATALIGTIFIVTGTGKYFKNVKGDPENNLGIIRIAQDGTTAELLWGYADGGLNSDHFNSCRMRPEEYPEYAGDQTADDDVDSYEEDNIERRGVTFRTDGKEIRYHAVVGADEKLTENATDLMRDAGKNFYEFRQQHPEVTEMHFYTDELVQMNE